MTQYLSDRRRVEAMFFPTLLRHVLVAGVVDREEPDFKAATALLAEAVWEAVGERMGAGEAGRKYRLMRRTVRLVDEVTAVYRHEGGLVSKVGLIGYHLLLAVTDSGYLQLGADTPMSRALDLILPALEDSPGAAQVDVSAQKQMPKLLRVLQGLGYFGDVHLVELANC